MGEGPDVVIHHTPPQSTDADVAVVIDVLRWTTTAITALANGAAGIEAFLTPDAAAERARAIGGLTAGERHAHKIPGFDLGNSPSEVTRERVQGRVICATTTNGTRALLATRDAAQTWLAAFVNLQVTAEAIRGLGAVRVDLVCAGTEGQPSDEDTACAEALRTLVRGGAPDMAPFLQRVHAARHATFLREAGYAYDVEHATKVDSVPLVARCDAAHRITASTPPYSHP